MKYVPPDGEVKDILEALGIDSDGNFAVELVTEDVIVLLHYKTHLEVTIRKGAKKEWLSTKKPCSA